MEADAVATAAEVYRTAVLEGKRPVVLVQTALGVSRATAHRYLSIARERGILPPVHPGRTASVADHEPRRLRWADGSESWLACRTCRVPWPCAQAADD